MNGLDGRQKEECGKILRLFGTSGADADQTSGLGPSRASFADCPLDEGWKTLAAERYLSYTEIKSENAINRITGTAENPRFTERVPADTVFRFSVTLKHLEGDEGLEEFLLEGLKLLQMDSLGGSGSRGYGRIRIEFDDPGLQESFDRLSPL